jgi:hypothetical protein
VAAAASALGWQGPPVVNSSSARRPMFTPAR